MGKKYSDSEIAKILVESDFAPKKDVYKKWGISEKTFYNYQALRDSNPEIARHYQYAKKLFADSWVDDASAALKAGSLRLKEMFRHASTEEDAAVIKAIAEACKTLGELSITYNALNEMDVSDPDAIGPQTVEASYKDVTDSAE